MPWWKDKKNKQREADPKDKKLEDHLREKELEREKLRNEELEFQRKKRDRERKIIEIEKEELEKRENEVRRRSSDLDELRRGHRAVEDKLEAKVKELKMELEDRRLAHSSEEQEVEYDLRNQKEKMNELRRSLNRRIEEFGELDLPSSSSSSSFSAIPANNPQPQQLYLTSPPSASSLHSQCSPPSAPPLLDLSSKGSCTEEEGGRQARKTDPQPLSIPTSAMSRVRVGSLSPQTERSRRGENKSERLSRCRSLARGEDEVVHSTSHRGGAPALVYPSIPTEEPMETAAAALPSVPQEDPGEDSYATLKPQRSSKKKPMLESVD